MNLVFTGVLATAVVVLLVAWRLFSSRTVSVDTDWLRKFSIDQYRPMERLFDQRDYHFLASQPGYVPAIAQRLRRERRDIFRTYLKSLRRDFDRLHTVAKLMMLYAVEDRSDLAGVLLRQRVLFFRTYWTVQAKLALRSTGLGRVEAGRLLSALDGLRMQLPQPSAGRA